MKCIVNLLDDEKFETELAKGASGKDLFDAVKDKLQLSEEADYFSISHKDAKYNIRRWLDMDKRVDKQMEGLQKPPYDFSFELKFYPPVPENLNEDLTRYFIVLQIRKDLFTGLLPASFHTLAILGSYTVQSELGDFDKNQHYGIEYLRPYSFAPYTSEELLMRIADLHRAHRGITPAEADLYFLQNAKRMSMYGMDIHKVMKDKLELRVGVAASGLYVYDGKLRIDCFKWQRMLKMSYKADNFLIKVRAGEYDKHDRTLILRCPNRKEAKRLLRTAVEHHQFFRLNQPEPVDSNTFGTFGSRRWRMSGRTQAQLKHTGTPGRGDTMSRSGSYMSQEGHLGTYPYSGGGTLPLSGPNAARRGDPNPYGTYGGPHSNDNRIITGYDDAGNPIYGDSVLNDSTLSRNDDGSYMMAPSGQMGGGRYQSEDDLLNERGYDAQTGQLTDNAMTLDRRENGGLVMAPNGGHMIPPPNDYESYEDLKNQQAQQQAALQQPPQPMYAPGVGDLPMPFFCSESAGVAQNGMIDYSIALDTHERSEKNLRERDTKLKNPRMTVDTNASKDDQELLDAILAVTGLDPRLCVDKIVIKTEEEAS